MNTEKPNSISRVLIVVYYTSLIFILLTKSINIPTYTTIYDGIKLISIYLFIVLLYFILAKLIILISKHRYIANFRNFDGIFRVNFKKFSIVIVLIACSYQIQNFMQQVHNRPIEPIGYSKILMQNGFIGKSYVAGVSDAIIWYYTKGPVYILEENPPLSLTRRFMHFANASDNGVTPDFYICDDTNNAYLKPGGSVSYFTNKEIINFQGKDCAFVANYLEKLNFIPYVVSSKYSILKFPEVSSRQHK